MLVIFVASPVEGLGVLIPTPVLYCQGCQNLVKYITPVTESNVFNATG